MNVQLRSACGTEELLESARAALAEMRQTCAVAPDVPAYTEAATALADAIDAAPGDPPSDLAAICHEFVDLARIPALRRAAYGTDHADPWINAVVRLIERSNFTVGRMFRARAAQYPDKTLFVVPNGEQVTEYSWRQVSELTGSLAGGILSVVGSDAAVALYTPNRIEGALIDLGCLTNGIFNAVVPANSVVEQVEQIVVESQARMLVVSGTNHLQNALSIASAVSGLECVVTLDEVPKVPGIRMLTYRELLDAGRQVPASQLDERLAKVRSADVASTMYTSGTTGKPKGIKFSHLNLVSKRYARAAALPDLDEEQVFLCYLPLYHTFGRWLEMLGCVHLAATYVMAENPSTETLIAHMQQFRPTAMISVPKKWQNIYDRVCSGDESPDDPSQVRRNVERLTGGRLAWGLSAAGRLDPEVFQFFQRNGVELLSGYGMTEATGGITMTPPGGYVRESIGKPLPAIEIDLGRDGELRLRGPYVTDGYVDPQDTAGSFRDGWLHTGDIVRQDEKGYLWHVDRKKDIYKNASGRTVAPQRIEALFGDFPEVSRVFAVGDGREYITLLIRPDFDCTEVALREMNPAELAEYFRGLVVSCNRFLAPFERVVNFALLDRDFSRDLNELTFKGSFRRSAVEENFRSVIDPMYVSTAIERQVDGLTVKVPVAFLQHLGATEAGTRMTAEGLEFRAVGKTLRIRRDPDAGDRVWVGNCCYHTPSANLNLDEWLRLPELWVGNAELLDTTGEDILLWSLASSEQATRAKMVAVSPPHIGVDERVERLQPAGRSVASLLTIHTAAVWLSTGSTSLGPTAIAHLEKTLALGLARHAALATRVLHLAAQHPDADMRSQAFAALYEHQSERNIEETARVFCASRRGFLGRAARAKLVELSIRPGRWQGLSRHLTNLRQQPADSRDPQDLDFALDLLDDLSRVPDHDWTLYAEICRELVGWMLAPLPEAGRARVARIFDDLTSRFRQWLGPVSETAADPDTGQSYTWADTLRFEDGIAPDDLRRIARAVAKTALVREAVWLFCDHRLVDLDDLAPGGIWVSMLTARFGRSMYRVTIRFRSQERCEFALFVRGAASATRFRTELGLMGMAAYDPRGVPLTARPGGYWPEFGVASGQFVREECLDDLVRAMHDHPDREVRQRLKDSWRHLCWSALAAAFELYRRTDHRWIMTGGLHRQVSVPLDDFDTSTHILSAAGSRRFHSSLMTLLRLKSGFLDLMCFKYPALAEGTSPEVILDAALESLGQADGLDFLRRARAEVARISQPAEEVVAFDRMIGEYIARIENAGYTPRAAHFAIARYMAWAEEVPHAAAHARAAALRELQSSYDLDAVFRRFPGSRLRLFAETVLRTVPAEDRRTIERSIRQLQDGNEPKAALAKLYADLHDLLDSHDLRYFLTRAAYPHLDLDEKAELVTISGAGADRLELVTQHTDRTGCELRIRPVANAREVDVLHRVFFLTGLGGVYRSSDQMLVLVDQDDYVIGGISYVRRTPTHVLLDKVAVRDRFRGNGLGRLLLGEFVRRLQAEGVSVVSAEFIRKDLLEQFGFKPNPRYAGIVLPLRITS